MSDGLGFGGASCRTRGHDNGKRKNDLSRLRLDRIRIRWKMPSMREHEGRGMIDTAFILRHSLKGFSRCPACRVYHFKGNICTQKLLAQTKRLIARFEHNPYKRNRPQN